MMPIEVTRIEMAGTERMDYTSYMSTKIIRDSVGKILATVYDSGTQTYLRDFTTNRVLASVRKNSDTVLDWTTNKPVKGREQLLRFVKS